MKKNTLLWRIEGKQLASPSYLFGTMHVQDKRAFEGMEILKNCIDTTDAFAAEYDLGQQDPQAFNAVSQFSGDKDLSDYLNPRIYKKLAHVFKRETGNSLSFFDDYKPIMIINILSAAQFSEDHQQALDHSLYQYAATQEKTLLGLESFEQQISIMGAMPLKEQLRSLKSIATNFRGFRRAVKRTTQLYLEGDLQKILKNVKETSGKMRKLLIYDRNVIMAKRILEITATQSLFAAVGAGHLGGSKGILRLLKKSDCQLTPILYRN